VKSIIISTNPINQLSPEPQELLLRLARRKVKTQVSAQQYQLYDLIEIKHWTLADIAKNLCVSDAVIRRAQHLVGTMIQKEIKILEENRTP